MAGNLYMIEPSPLALQLRTGVILVDDRGRMPAVNAPIEKLFGYRATRSSANRSEG